MISLALGDAGDMVERAHAVGPLFVQHMGTSFLASLEATIPD